MKRILMCIGVSATCVIAGEVSALTTDGDWSDWFSYNGNVATADWEQGNYTLQNLNIRTQADEEGPTPGGGAQDYDNEEIFYFFEDSDPNSLTGGILHIGLVTGFDPLGENLGGAFNGPHYAGDMFVNFGASGGFDVAIATGQENTPENDGGARFGQAWYNTGAPNWSELPVNEPGHLASSPYRIDENQPGADDIANAGYSVDVAWGGMGLHNFLEIALTVDGGAEDSLANGVGLHWTMLCGNDVTNVIDDEPLGPLPIIPEPATLVLLGMGVVGVTLRAKRPQC